MPNINYKLMWGKLQEWLGQESITAMSKSDLNKLVKNIIDNKIDEIGNLKVSAFTRLLKFFKILIFVTITGFSIDPIANLFSDHYQNEENKETITNLNNVAKNMYFREYAPDIALKIIDKSLNIDEQNAETIYLKSFISSMEVVDQLKNLDRPYNLDELQKAQLALANAEFILESDEHDFYPNAYLVKAQTYYALDEIDDAVFYIDKAINQNPSPFYKIRKSTILIEIGKEENNLEKINLGLKILTKLENELNITTNKDDIKWVYTYKAIGLSYKMELENIVDNKIETQIKEYYKKALDIDKKFHLALFNYANFLQSISTEANRIDEAIKQYKKILSILPNNKEVYFQLAKIYGKIDKYEKSLVYLNKALDVDNNYFSANFLKAKVLYEKRNFEDALKYLNNAIKINPNDFEVFSIRGVTYIELNDFFNAEKDFFEIIDNIELATDKNKDIFVDANFYLADLYISQNKFEQALERIISIEKFKVANYSEYHKVKFRYFKGINNTEEALKSIDKAIEYSNENKTKNRLEKIDFLIKLNDCKKANDELELIDKEKEQFEVRNKIEETQVLLNNCTNKNN